MSGGFMENGGMKRPFCALALLLALAGPAPAQQPFPEREAAARQADSFFRQLRLESPGVRQLQTLVADRNYQTAFLNLSETLAGDPFVVRLCALLDSEQFGLVNRFRPMAGELSPATWRPVMERLGVASPLLLAQLAVHSMVRRYGANELGAPLAMRHWLTLLQMLRSSSARCRGAGDAGLLLLGAQLDLFKAGRHWRKTGQRWLRRHPEAAADDDLRRLAAAQGGMP
jgi:hypothetical protein